MPKVEVSPQQNQTILDSYPSLTLQEISALTNLSLSVVRRILMENNVELRQPGHRPVQINELEQYMLDYESGAISLSEIADMIKKKVKKEGIRRRFTNTITLGGRAKKEQL